jgi:carbon storage regulator
MLVLTRKSNERILIGNDVEVVVLSVQGQRVRLGIIAASDKAIRREECGLPSSVDRAPILTEAN